MDHYQLLGIKDDASKEEIKQAFNKLARRYHPDKNHATNAKEKFIETKVAYEVLYNEKTREHYDRFDLPQVRSSRPRSHSHQTSKHRHKYDHQFFYGASESHGYQDELDRIRRKNSDLLEAANARLRKSKVSRTTSSSKWDCKQKSGIFVGDIMPEKNDTEYEKIVLARLRALGRQ